MAKTPFETQINTLAVFHYLLSVPIGLMSLLSLPLVFAGLNLMRGEHSELDQAAFFSGATFLVWAAIIAISALGMAVCLLLGGLYLTKRRHHPFCLAVAGVSCLFVPLGTALGIATILFLTRDTTKEMFDRG
jgi:formate-dependent nitrite reductase membrane component NrfD